ncbi:MAG: class I SAM-dependent methyltransferase [Nitrospirae bacterium]|nr:class I SAM-dependent methyltransferase [Nitrospirota bacterium]
MANNKGKEVHYGTWEIGGPRHFYREGLILENLRKCLPSGRILDVGCGTGSLMAKLALQGYHVYGIDMSDECLRVTAERMKRLSPGITAEVRRGSALEADYPDRFFDAIIAAEVLEHLEEDHKAVREFSRLLRPGGLCLITVPSNQRLWDKWDEMAGHKRRYSREDITRLFTDQSFSVEKIFTWGFPLMRFYHRIVFLMWARHIDKKSGGKISCDDRATRIGLSRWTTLILGNLFRIDNIFSSLPWGIGMLLVARKR